MLLTVRKDISARLKREHSDVANIVKSVANMHPQNVLKRGYTMTLINGRAISKVEQVNLTDTLHTVLFDGSIISEVKSTSKTDNHE
jgi:exodeoxyribonuclease VII large subunit